jgi:hypothetical protein
VSDGIPPNLGSVGRGVLVGLGLTFGAIVVGLVSAAFTGGISAIVLLGIGVLQAAWIVPLVRSYRTKGETETAKGLLIAAGIVFLLNASCWGVVASMR